ncbi:MAG: ABC transporter ATP-binding protein [Clostridium sp.]|uniref:ABC transporter ATP-binding protein n=1 Tax=Clostridium sp. TaxID=1506 RepID=UPI0039EC92BA
MAKENSIVIEHLNKSYNESSKNESKYVLEDINLNLDGGQFFILLGPSGCGKSTLLNIIAGFIEKTEGNVLIGNKKVDKPGRERAVVFQHPDASLFSWLNVKENVEFGLKMKRVSKEEKSKISSKYIELVGLTGHEKKFPHELSGGMKQRVQLARVLANDPQILLMDEPFGALDAQTRRIMQKELVRIWLETKKTVVFVTHDIQEALILGQKIGIMSKSPSASIYKIYDVDFPYPRNITSSEFNEQYRKLLGEFEEESAYAQPKLEKNHYYQPKVSVL